MFVYVFFSVTNLFRWVADDWQSCSLSCGDGGVSRRHLYCVVKSSSDQTPQPVDDRLCLPEERPSSERPCSAAVDCPTWVAGQWSHVSQQHTLYQTQCTGCLPQKLTHFVLYALTLYALTSSNTDRFSNFFSLSESGEHL